MWKTKSAKPKKGKIRMQRASKFNKKTHFLENTKRETNRVTEFKQVGGHSQTKEHKERNQSEHRRQQASEGHLRPVKHGGRDSSGQQKQASKKGALAFCRVQKEGRVRTEKEIRQARDTHFLLNTDGGTSEDSERMRASKGCSRPVECRGRLIRTAKESRQARGTHSLLSAEIGTSQNGRGKSTSERHSRTVERRMRGDKSGS